MSLELGIKEEFLGQMIMRESGVMCVSDEG